MNPIVFLIKHFWLICIFVTFVNLGFYIKRSRKEIQRDPSLKNGYRRIFLGYAIWLNIPWVIMGAGILFGGIPHILYYFRPLDGNPFVVSWFLSVFVLWIAGFVWIFLLGGARTLIKYPGAFNRDLSSEDAVKLLYCLVVGCGVTGFVMILVMKIPVVPLPFP